MTHCAVLAALLAVCAWISVPVGSGVVSLQTFGVFLALGLLGGKLGSLTVLVYLLLGAVGLPVFTGFRGGISALLGPTGGYLWGFLVVSLIYWCLEKHLPRWLSMTFGLLGCYLCGTVWYCVFYAEGTLLLVLLTCVVPYVIPDAVKLLISLTVCDRLNRLMCRNR